MVEYVFLGRRQMPSLKLDETALGHACRERFEAVDVDGDGRLTRSELEAQYAKTAFEPPWTEARSAVLLEEVRSEKQRWQAEDALLFHDDNGDGAISLGEFEDSVLKFVAVMKRSRYLRKTRNRKQLFAKEQHWIRKHMCTSDDCVHLEQLQRDYEGRERRGRAAEL